MAKKTMLAAMSGGDPKDPKKDKALVARAEADAKNFAVRRGLLTGEDTNTGGVVPKVTLDGREIPYGAPMPGPKMAYHPVPKDVSEFERDKDGHPFFMDPRTGDMRYFDPAYINLPQFKKKAKAS